MLRVTYVNFQRKLVRKILSCFLITSLLSLLLQFGLAAPVQAAPGAPYTLVWSDEFNDTSVDLTKWQRNIPDNSGDIPSDCVTESDGYLHLITKKNSSGQYITGTVCTRDKYEFTYGWAEARIKLLNVSASDCAFWMMPHWDTATNYFSFMGLGGSGAEIDIMEHWYPINDDKVMSAIHWGGYGTNHHVVNSDANGWWLTPISNWTTDFHTYAVEWTPTSYDFYVDGVLRYSYSGEGVAYGPEMLVLSLGLGDWNNNPINDSMLPAEALVDYCRVYQKSADGGVITYNDSSATYTGSGWGYVTNTSGRYNTDYHSTQTANDKMTFNFSGTDAKVYGTMNGWSGKADVYLDGAYKTTVDTYSATQGFQQLLYDTGTLSSGSHKIDMIVLGQKNTSSTGLWIEVDKFDVMASTPASQTLNDTDSSMTYTGSGWGYSTNSANDYNTDYHSSMTANDKYTLNFNGTSAQIYGHKNGWSGKADVYLDGVYKTTVDSYSATQSYQQLLYDTGTLSSGSHKIEMIVQGQKNTSSTGYWLTVDKAVVTSSSTLVTQTLNDTDSAIVYSGTWGTGTKSACYNGDYHSSTTMNSYFQNTFSGGTREKVYMTKNDWCGKADVYLDGVYQQTIDMYNSTEVCQQMVYDTGDLSAGSHTVKVIVNGQKNASSNGYWIELDKIETIN